MTHYANITRLTDGEACELTDAVVTEAPVALVYNGISHAVMMASPTDLEDFALGFSLTEGILESADQLYDLGIEHTPDGIEVSMDIHGQAFDRLKQRRRQLTGRSGCGLCGVDSLAQAMRPIPSVTPQAIDPEALQHALQQLPAAQIHNQATGAAHAAAWCTPDGEIQALREDVGRHNALDKLIGHYRGTLADGFILISSRASYEMIHKACSAGAGALAAVSAPTSLAVQCAHQAGLTLVGFARPGRHQTYGNLV